MQVFGHRGGKQYGPENTIGTIKKSLALGAHGAELDIRCSMDDKPVIIHDATIDRTTGKSGEICKMNADVIVKLSAGEQEHVPSLLQVLEAFRKTDATFLLELKHPTTALPTAELVQHFVLNKGMAQHRLVVISFYHQLLALVKDEHPKIVTGASLKEIPESLAACGEYTHSHYVLPPIDALDEAFMHDAQRRGVSVIAWVCDSDEQIAKARRLGVYGVIASDPKYVLDRLG